MTALVVETKRASKTTETASDGDSLLFAKYLMEEVCREMMGGNAEAQRIYLCALRRMPKVRVMV